MTAGYAARLAKADVQQCSALEEEGALVAAQRLDCRMILTMQLAVALVDDGGHGREHLRLRRATNERHALHSVISRGIPKDAKMAATSALL